MLVPLAAVAIYGYLIGQTINPVRFSDRHTETTPPQIPRSDPVVGGSRGCRVPSDADIRWASKHGSPQEREQLLRQISGNRGEHLYSHQVLLELAGLNDVEFLTRMRDHFQPVDGLKYHFLTTLAKEHGATLSTRKALVRLGLGYPDPEVLQALKDDCDARGLLERAVKKDERGISEWTSKSMKACKTCIAMEPGSTPDLRDWLLETGFPQYVDAHVPKCPNYDHECLVDREARIAELRVSCKEALRDTPFLGVEDKQ